LTARGGSMRERAPATRRPAEAAAKVRWYLGDNATELFAWVRDGAPPHHIQLVFARVSAEWSQAGGLSTGTFTTGSSTAGGRYDPYLLTVGQSVDEEVCRAALLLLRASKVDSAIAGPMIGAIEAALQTAPRAPGA
ncbi:MAG: hypothetical protein ACYC8T_10295, partial [Myxococcaceae bacterium]